MLPRDGMDAMAHKDRGGHFIRAGSGADMPNIKTRAMAAAWLLASMGVCAAAYHVVSTRMDRGGGVAVSSMREAPVRGSGYVGLPVQATLPADGGIHSPAATVEQSPEGGRGTFIVVFREDALASYKGGRPGLPAPSRRMAATGRLRIDPHGNPSRNYVRFLQGRQQQYERQMAGMIRRPLHVRKRMQHALNSIITDLSEQEAARIRGMAGVRLVEEYREYELHTDTGPTLIGAPAVWAGTFPDAPTQYRGEGIVFGIIDTGINFGSPSFAAIDPIDNYAHTNPLGSGSYLGTCAAGGPDAGRCNNKLIGGHDFVCDAPAFQCSLPGAREEPGFGDTNGHGSHTASIAAGNRRDVTYSGSTYRISGVAPRGNIIMYDACYTSTSTGGGSCPSVSTVSAVNQAILDGIVDVINFSIAGGTSPWNDATSTAFLNAVDAGIYVAASAGNSGPGANTLSHLEPWVASTAASQHGRGEFVAPLTVTAPTPVPPALAPLLMGEGSGGTPHLSAIPGTTPLRVSAGFDTANDGCASYTPGTFSGAIAVVRRGTCTFAVKANNAAAAGALAVVISNNVAGEFGVSAPGATVPTFSITQAEGNLVRDFAAANPSATTAGIGFPMFTMPNRADALGGFSSRGPAGAFDLLKPDVTAPGVSILAAYSGTTLTGSENLVAPLNGTSMAAPHHAGAAGLIRQARPGWTPSEIKSALMMTATPEVYLEDETTPADPFARGAGRIRVDRAINARLVLNETFANYQAANPANGGNPAGLNLASLGNGRCAPVCEFTRVFRNTHPGGSAWRVQFNGGVPGTAIPTVFWVPPGGTKSVKFVIDTSQLPNNSTWSFGQVQMINLLSGNQFDEPSTLRLPIAVAIPPPVISVPTSVSANLVSGNPGAATFNVGNIGASNLNYTVSNSGNGVQTLVNAPRGTSSTGTRSTVYSDTTNPPAQFSADDFTLGAQTQLSTIAVEGFVVSGAALTSAATGLTWSIFPDASGAPAGNPHSSPGNAVWTYTAAPTSSAVSISGGSFTLNLAAAGQNVTLLPGRYWLVVNTRGTFTNRWAWYASSSGTAPFMTITVNPDGSGSWVSTSSPSGLSMRVAGTTACGAPWLGAATPASGVVAPSANQSTSVALNGAGLAAGNYRASVCVHSNDPVTPVAAVPIQLTVTP
ncbi:MAG: protease domain-containing protein [Lysobacteraceae bacterium]|nr:MAG: protease domain-containing protein [Xanthomonadaceae bacterium]